MQENEFLFSQDNEDGVSKFGNFREHKHPSPEAAHTVSLNEASKSLCLVFFYPNLYSPWNTEGVVNAMS